MTAVLGLRSHHSNFFPGVIAWDPITVSFWSDEAAMTAFVHKHGPHRRQMDRYRMTGNADRTSFTRLTVLWRTGTWYGADPAAVEAEHS